MNLGTVLRGGTDRRQHDERLPQHRLAEGSGTPGNTHIHELLPRFEYKQGSFRAGTAAPFIKPKCFNTWLQKETTVLLGYVAAAFLMPHKCLQPSWMQMTLGAQASATSSRLQGCPQPCRAKPAFVSASSPPSPPSSHTEAAPGRGTRAGRQRPAQRRAAARAHHGGTVPGPPPHQLTMSRLACGARSTSP